MFMTTIKTTVGGRRRHLAVCKGKDGWQLQWAEPTAHGHRYEPPLRWRYSTKRQAVRAKRLIIEGT
jgi:hypothetical protein